MGETISRAAFHDRLTPQLAALLRRLVDWCFETKLDSLQSDIGEVLEEFRSLLAVDSTVINLHELLAPTWAATNEGEAACKMHIISNVVTNGANSVKSTDQRTADIGPMKRIGSWVRGSLLMGDLGYYGFHLFHRIAQQGGYEPRPRRRQSTHCRVSSDRSRPLDRPGVTRRAI